MSERERVWSKTWDTVLWDSDRDSGTAVGFVVASGYDWLPVTLDAQGFRWAGRIEALRINLDELLWPR